jgi:hypothetical protein
MGSRKILDARSRGKYKDGLYFESRAHQKKSKGCF